MRRYLKLSILIDNPKSWLNLYLGDLCEVIRKYDSGFIFVQNAADIPKGNILFILSCNRILDNKALSKNQHNIVIHEGDLPRDRGWSPLTWQVERGRRIIPITLLEASENVDAGDYYIKDKIILDGTELIDELRHKLFMKTIEVLVRYLRGFPMKPIPQKGKATYNRKRAPKDNELSVNKSIKSQFNKMRVADNQRYPLYFRYRGKKYVIKIYPAKENL